MAKIRANMLGQDRDTTLQVSLVRTDERPESSAGSLREAMSFGDNAPFALRNHEHNVEVVSK